MAKHVIEIICRCMNVADDKLKTLENFIPEEIEDIHKEQEGCQRSEFEMKEATLPWSVGLWKRLA